MIRSVIFIFLVLDSSVSLAQKVLVSPDSSRLMFPNQVAIDFARNRRKGSTAFEFDKPAFKTLLIQWNYVYGTLDVKMESVRLLEKELIVKDSIIQSLKKQVQVADERLLVYSSGYQDLKAVTSAYDSQVKALIAEIETIRKKDRKAKRRIFLKGAIAGLAGGIVSTSFILRRN